MNQNGISKEERAALDAALPKPTDAQKVKEDRLLQDAGEEVAFGMAHFYRAYQELGKTEILDRARFVKVAMSRFEERINELIERYESI